MNNIKCMKCALAAVSALGVAFTVSAASPLDEFAGWKTETIDESVILDAFDDPEFESVAKFGKENDHVEYGHFGYNGNGGMRVRPLQLAYSKCFKLKAKLKKGQRYVWSADIRKHGKTMVQTCMDAYYRNPRKYVSGGGAWGPASVPKDQGWVRQTVDFIAKGDSDEIDYCFMIYCRLPSEVAKDDPKNPENYVDVDNLRLETAAPKWHVSNTWPIRNLVHGAEGRVRMNSSFFGDYLEKDAKPVYGARLTDAAGVTLAEDVKTADANGNFTLEFGKLAYRGKVTLAISLYDRTRRLCRGIRTIALEVADPVVDRGIFVKENGVVLKNGKPYMPVGFYANFAYPSTKGFPEDYTPEEAEKCLRELHEAGFNAIIDYSSYMLHGPRLDWYYGACAKYGIDVLADDFKETNFKELDRKMVKFRERAEKLKKYPALVGFYTMDESPESAIPALEKIRRMLNEVMPDRVVNICNIMRPAPYLPIADIQGGDSYPISRDGSTLDTVDNRVGQMNRLHPAAIWYAPQMYNWAAGTPGARNDPELYRKSGREPQENEILAVALCNVVNGVKGFFFYSYFDIYRCPVKAWIPKRWAWACSACRCLRDLEPFIMSGEPLEELAKTDRGDRTRVTALSDGKGNRRVIVLGLGKQHDTEFTLPAGFGELKSRCGKAVKDGGRWLFRAGDFTCDVLE